MAGIRVEGNTSGNVAEVDTNNNLFVTTPKKVANSGFALLAGQNGDGTYTSAAYNQTVRVSDGNRLYVAIDTPLFDYNFTATSQDTGVWKYQATTQTIAQSAGFATFNSGASVATTTACSLQTWHYFTLRGAGLRMGFTGALSANIPAAQVIEMGLYLGGSTGTPTDGVYVRLSSAGITGVLNYNGTETTALFSTAAVTALMGVNVNFEIDVICYLGTVEFYIEDFFLGEIAVPAGNGVPFLSTGLPLCVQERNTGAVTGSTSYKLAHVHVEALDADVNIPFAHQQALMGLNASQATQGNTMGSTELLTNNLLAGAGAAMTNTTAALGTGLGGQFAALPTLTVGTDGIVCSYQNPAGSTTVPARKLVVTGIRVQGAVTTILAAGPVLYEYSLAYGHTAVSLATAEGTSFSTSPTTKAPRRIILGFETYAATAAVGTIGAGVYMPFNSPVIVNPGEFVAICAKNFGLITTSGVITFSVTFDAYWA